MAGPQEPEPERRRPLWANAKVWALFGALIGAGMFLWSERRALERAARARIPQARAAARQAQVTAGQVASAAAKAAGSAAGSAKDLAGDLALPEEEPEQRSGPSADTLSAPVDPSRPRRRAPTVQARSLAGRKRVGEREFKSAGGVQDVRARWDAPDVSFEAPVPWLETDMGRGIKQTGGLAIFFGLLGWVLMRFTSNREKTF